MINKTVNVIKNNVWKTVTIAITILTLVQIPKHVYSFRIVRGDVLTLPHVSKVSH